MTSPILSIDNLIVSLGKRSNNARIIDGVSLRVREGTTLGVVGESGGSRVLTFGAAAGLRSA